MAGYAFAKLRFRGRERIFQLLLGALVIPAQVAMLPLFLMLKQLGLVNTYGGVIVPAMASIFGIFLVRQYALLASPTSCSRRRASTAPASSASSWRIVLPLLQADPGDARDLHLPRQPGTTSCGR